MHKKASLECSRLISLLIGRRTIAPSGAFLYLRLLQNGTAKTKATISEVNIHAESKNIKTTLYNTSFARSIYLK